MVVFAGELISRAEKNAIIVQQRAKSGMCIIRLEECFA
jgi:hypothetical protein